MTCYFVRPGGFTDSTVLLLFGWPDQAARDIPAAERALYVAADRSTRRPLHAISYGQACELQKIGELEAVTDAEARRLLANGPDAAMETAP